MSESGYTLIELLVVISIISIMSVMGFISFKGFAEDQATKKAEGQIQSLLRLAQSNATTSTLCNGQGATSWSLKFVDSTHMELHCDPGDVKAREYTFENAQVEVKGDSGCLIGLPVAISYAPGLGTQSLSSGDISTTGACLQSSAVTFTITNTLNNSSKSFKMSKGGAINAQ